jgi:peptidoglycan hydrolase-like protein with peptidoglycan-binding domain
MAIRAYNNSTAYALGVGLLADGIGGAQPLVKAWPDDPPLGLADRMAAQQALIKLGFDTGAVDGVFGVATRKAARGWQASQGLPADGYLTLGLIGMLKLQAGIGTADAAAPVPESPPRQPPPSA